MRLRNIIAMVVICCFLTGCLTLMEQLMPKVTQEQIAVILAKADAVKFKKTKSLRNSKKDRMPIKKGQWVTTLTKNKTGDLDVSLTTTRIIDVRGNTVVIETEMYSAADNGERKVSQMTIENYPVKSKLSYSQAEFDRFVQNMKITRIINKVGSEPPQDVPAPMLSMMQGLSKGTLSSSIRTGEMQKTKCNTGYLKSSRCYDYNFSVSAMGVAMTGTVTANSNVPVNGLVKMETDRMTQETIAFGNKGARSLIY